MGMGLFTFRDCPDAYEELMLVRDIPFIPSIPYTARLSSGLYGFRGGIDDEVLICIY